ncbi:MAG: nicotinate (nicotinamide) nucleotide adenylyltransferase [Spirochaetia bacterium]
MRILIFGGSFNPVHIGHLFIAQAAAQECGYEKVLFIPAYAAPHKDTPVAVDGEERLRMLKTAVQGNSDFLVETCELERKGASYTIDTIKELYPKYQPQGKFGLLIGDDLAAGFHTWERADELSNLIDLVIAKRDNQKAPQINYHFTLLKNRLLPISSTQIRKMLENTERCTRYLLPSGVYDYITEKRLYV